MAEPVSIQPAGDLAAEQAVLAAALMSTVARQEARKALTGADFHEPAHEAVWDAMGRLDRHGKQVDPVTVLSVVRDNQRATAVLPDLVTAPALPDHVGDYAGIVRNWAVKRRMWALAKHIEQHALNPDTNAVGFAASVATQAAGIRDAGNPDDTTALTIAELLAEADTEPDWLIPGYLERRDRLMLTGIEGLGKSVVLRQIAILAAAGLDPWDLSRRFAPIKAVVIDCENTQAQVRRKLRALVTLAARHGDDPSDRVLVDCTTRMDITRDRDLARIHRLLDAAQPDLVCIGPLYRLVPRALQTDDEAGPVLAALDTIRDRGIALVIEAHSGHAVGRGGERDMRPRGSSALLGWPEFGYGLRPCGQEGVADLVPWRGNREERDWPARLRRADGFRWVPHYDAYTG